MSLRLTSQPKSPYLYADFDVWNESKQRMERRLVSTKKRTKADAWPVAVQISRMAGAASDSAASGWTYEQVHQMVTEFLAVTGARAPGDSLSETWATFSARWIQEQRVRPSSLGIYRRRIQSLTKWLGDRSTTPLPTITAAMAQAYYDDQLENGMLTTTAADNMAFFQRVFQRAMDEGLIARNPFVLVRRANNHVPRRQPFTLEEFEALVVRTRIENKPDWEMMLWLGLCTAARLQDCARMSTEHLDAKRWTLTYREQKGRDHSPEKTVPVVEPLKGAIMRFLAEGRTGPFCPSLSHMVSSVLSGTFRRLLDRAGLGAVRVQGVRSQRARCFHCLRHTLPTWLESAGVSESTKMAITGHKSVQVHRNYTHHELEGMREALERGLARVTVAAQPPA